MEASQSPPAIFRLPEEILRLILSYACTGPPGRKITLANLSLTCKRFNRISHPVFYESIWICQGPDPGLSWQAGEIHSRFQEYPSLRRYCRALSLDIVYVSKNDYSRIVDLLNWLTNVRYLCIHGIFTNTEPDQPIDQMDNDFPSFEYNMLDLLKLVARRMRRLEVLHCKDVNRRDLGGCNGADFMRDIDIPSLKRLELFRLGRSEEPPSSDKVWSGQEKPDLSITFSAY